MWKVLKALGEDERGATAIEYVFIAGFIAIVIVGSVSVIGTRLNANYYGPVAAGFAR